MKIKLLKLLIWIFCCGACEGQNIELKNLLTYLGDKEFRIGMTLKEFIKIEKGYYLVNRDSLLLGKDILSPLHLQIFAKDSITNGDTPEKFINHQINRIYYVFNNRKKLVKINWFLPNTDEKDQVINDITNLLGKPTSTEKNIDENEDNIIWIRDSLSLIYQHYNNPDRLVISLTHSFIAEDLDFTDVNKKYEKLLKVNRRGKGNQTFNLSFISLEKIVTSGITAKEFENILPVWETNTYYNRVDVRTNEKTKINNILVFQLAYDFKVKNNYVTAIIEIKGNIYSKINCIEVTYSPGGEALAKFRNDLKVKGYYFDEILTKISYNFRENKDIYVNTSKGVMVLINAKNGGYTFELRKL